MTQYDKLWNYYNPAETETKFREVLKETSPDKDLSEHLQLLTQLARTQSLQRKFDEAHNILDQVSPQLPAHSEIAHVRYYLERGRTFNSAGDKRNAEVCFTKAYELAKEVGEDGYAVDALHMLAIIAPPDEAIALNEEAIVLSESSANQQAKNWLGSLYNNLAWGYFDLGQYEKALSIFLRALQWREEKKSPHEIFLAKWSVARTLRALNRIDHALTIQLGLFEEAASNGDNDGYVHEELGELFLLKNDKLKYPFHFEKAYELLSTDPYLSQKEQPRLERMKELSK
ncbi:MAG TPA: tetratricopeptide repeat protein [Chitinophagales bacterium]|nr:tetratricopeptide repeat protein [Chitinophagales bacterium]